jgi:hypothetical protein
MGNEKKYDPQIKRIARKCVYLHRLIKKGIHIADSINLASS